MIGQPSKPVLVVGGGIAGITAAVELADAGCAVVLVERMASLGGRVARMHQYFPKLCPPACGLEMHYRRLRESHTITVLTQARVTGIAGSAGAFEVTVEIEPRFVNGYCTLCGVCEGACPVERKEQFNYGMAKSKAIFLPGGIPFPPQYVIDRHACRAGCRACQDVCPYGAIQLDAQPQTSTLNVASIVLATGWKPYEAARLEHLGFGKCRNVVTNVMFERLAAADGPTGGRIVRPSDGNEPRTVAFVQCAGSRDENHLPYCSAVCCTASFKHAGYIRARYPETAITIFYIDLRTPGRLEEFAAGVEREANTNLRLVKGKATRVEENHATGDLLLTAEDTLTGRKSTMQFELVVLATGMVPETDGLPQALERDDFGFLRADCGSGIYAAGCVNRPADVASAVQDATGAALQALQGAKRSASHA